MNTKRVTSAAEVVLAALTQNRTAAGIALALESAGMLTVQAAPNDVLAKVRNEAWQELRRDTGESRTTWRTVITDSESPTGLAPVCTGERSDALHMIHDYPGGPQRDEDGFYDCCPYPQIETCSTVWAEYLAGLLNADASDELSGAYLARWEEEQENGRLRLALKSAQRGRREARVRVAELEQGLALPWAHAMPDDDLAGFLDSLVSAALDRWRTGPSGEALPNRQTLAAIEKACAQWRTPGQGYRSDEDAEEQPLTVYRAEHESIVMGLYTTAAEARKHCESEERRSWGPGHTLVFDWLKDDEEEDSVAELVVTAGQNEQSTTGYVVTPIEVASAFDPDADE